MKSIVNFKWNYICILIVTGSEYEYLASWIKTERKNKYKTFKAVFANIEADDKGIINFCTDNIKVTNTDYVQLLKCIFLTKYSHKFKTIKMILNKNFISHISKIY